jgi:hypothetical protein
MLEGHINIVPCFGARLKEDEVFLPCKSRTLIERNLPIALEVSLVSHKGEDDVLVRLRFRFREPSRDVVERPAIRNVVDEEGRGGAAVVAANQRSKAILSGCVPNL